VASPKILEKKKQSVEKLDEIFAHGGVYMFDYRGLKVSEMETLRRQIRDLGAGVKVIQNRLVIKYFEKQKMAFGRDLFKGTLAAAYSRDHYVETAKALVNFEKESKKIKIKYGFIDRSLVNEAQIAEVAKLPGRDILLAQLAGSIIMPLRKFGSALSAPLTSMLILMKNYKDKKEKGG
jgi:large subunit ribosomal protein L10